MLCALMASCAPEDGRACDTTAVITGEGLGPLRVGSPLAEVEAACGPVRDFVARGIEGTLERYFEVDFGDADVRAIVVEDSVWRIHVDSPAFMTPDSIGVGVPLSRLLRFSDIRAAEGEGDLYVLTAEHCGLSFRLSDVPPAASARRNGWTREDLAALPVGTEVREVLIFGCHR